MGSARAQLNVKKCRTKVLKTRSTTPGGLTDEAAGRAAAGGTAVRSAQVGRARAWSAKAGYRPKRAPLARRRCRCRTEARELEALIVQHDRGRAVKGVHAERDAVDLAEEAVKGEGGAPLKRAIGAALLPHHPSEHVATGGAPPGNPSA